MLFCAAIFNLHDYDMKVPYFAFCGERRQATNFLNLDMVPRNSTLVGLPYIRQIMWVGGLKERNFTAGSR